MSLTRATIPDVIAQAVALHQAGSLVAAEVLYHQVLQIDPRDLNALFNLGNLELQRGDAAKAEDYFRRVIAIHAQILQAHFALGNALQQLRRFDAAAESYAAASALDPNDPAFHYNRGIALDAAGKFEAAIASYNAALMHASGDIKILQNRAATLAKAQRYDEALIDANAALTIDPNFALAIDTRATALKGLHRFDEALSEYDRALALAQHMTASHWNKSLIHLLQGDYVRGLPLFEYRWETEYHRHQVRKFNAPLWLGAEEIHGKTIFVYPEQGLGDFIQHVRYVHALVARGAKVILETPPALLSLIVPSFAGEAVTVVMRDQTLPTFHFQCPIMSLQLAFSTTLETIPAKVPYLTVNAEKRAEWNTKLGVKTQPRIGLVWSGEAKHLNDANRSILLAQLAPILQLPFEFHALQKEVRERDLPTFAQLRDHRAELHDFADTAALISAMDLVISVDTSVAHLAGALGAPLWLFLPHPPDYRWLLERGDTPWYPSAQLFRQGAAGDWSGAIGRVVEALEKRENHGR